MVTRITQYWHPVAESQEIGSEPLAIELLGMPVVLFRSGDELVALRDLCVHRGAQLSMGSIVETCLVCPYHGWRYDAGGRCVAIPSLAPGSAIPTAARSPKYRVQDRHSLVWIALEEPVLPIPELPSVAPDDQTYVSRCWARLVWNTSAGRVVENAMDLAHFPFVHPYLLADPATPAVLDYEVEVAEGGVSFSTGRFRCTQDGQPEAAGWTTYVHDFPFTHHLRIVEPSPDGEIITIFTAFHQPVKRDRTRIWWLAHKNRPFSAQDDADIQTFMTVLEQDQRIAESLRPEDIPTDLREELHLKVPDAPSIAFRRWLQTVDLMGMQAS